MKNTEKRRNERELASPCQPFGNIAHVAASIANAASNVAIVLRSLEGNGVTISALCDTTFLFRSMNIAWPKNRAIAGPTDAGDDVKALRGTNEGDTVFKHPIKATVPPKISMIDFA